MPCHLYWRERAVFHRSTLAWATACRQCATLNNGFFKCISLKKKKKTYLERNAQHWKWNAGLCTRRKILFAITMVLWTVLCPVQLLNSASQGCLVRANTVALYRTKTKGRPSFGGGWGRGRVKQQQSSFFYYFIFSFLFLRTVVHSRSIFSVPLRCDGHFHGLVL